MQTGEEALRHRRTKIVATLGPASSTPERMEQLIRAGVNVFRMNLSHGTQEQHRAVYELADAARSRLAAPVAIFADLCGPKIRVGTFSKGYATLPSGGTVTVTTRQVEGHDQLVSSAYESLARDVGVGDRILLDDGNLELKVVAISGTEITCTVVVGGVLKNKKGMNLPGVAISSPSLTEKDRLDALFALDLGVDFLALSFVRQAADVDDLRKLMDGASRRVPIIAKIEKPEALANIESIILAADAVMVARGDLGVELPPEAVPNIQEQLVDLARAQSKPVIVATQMLESMISSPRPTRAEVTDVANAVRSGADAVMLSGETAAGQYPVEAVRMMDLIVRQTESYLFHHGSFGTFDTYTPTCCGSAPLTVDQAVASATAQLSRDLQVQGIVALTRTGRSMTVMSAARPAAPIVGVSADAAVSRLGCLLWGVQPAVVTEERFATGLETAHALARQHQLEETDRPLLVVQGFHADDRATRPSVTVVAVGGG